MNTRLRAATGVEAILEDGRRIPTRTLVSTAPASPHPLVESLGLPRDGAGRLAANSFLEVEGAERVWALGDNALVPLAGGRGSSPPTAQHAIRQAKVAAHNIVAAIRGGQKREFGPGEFFGEMAVLGDTTRNATVRSVEALDVVSLPRREFTLVTSKLPDARQRFGEVVRRRRRATAVAFGHPI